MRTIDSRCAPSSVPRDFMHAFKKITRRRTDNQPGAVRTSAWFDKSACCPEPADSSERIPHPNTRAKATKAACLRTASSVRMGWMNNIAAVGCVVGENEKIKGYQDRPPHRKASQFRALGDGSPCSRLQSEDRVLRAPLPIPKQFLLLH